MSTNSSSTSGLMSPSHEEEHFPSFDDRARSSARNATRNGRISPAHSAHGILIRSSLLKIQTEKRAKKVHFYRNGDRFYTGTVCAISPERFRTFESLLAELTESPLCDKAVMPNGVRCIFSMDGTRRITSLSELEDGESYVCASTNAFKAMEYPKSSNPNWGIRTHSGGRKLSTDSRDGNSMPGSFQNSDTEYIKPKLITIIRNGTKPRKAVRMLLNRKTAHTFEQVMSDITETIKLDSGAVKKIFTIDGKQVTCLHDFFKEDNIFVAYGTERYTQDDFDTVENEIRFVSAYQSVRQRERITLKSPKMARKFGRETSITPSQSPKVSRRLFPQAPLSPARTKPSNANKSPSHSVKAVNGLHEANGIDIGSSSPPTKLLSRYSISKVIGNGNFAVVKECIEIPTREKFALKIINKKKCEGKKEMIDNEVNILRRVKHPNIIQLIDDYDTATELYLVMELINGGDLFDAIASSTKYTERDASGMLYNLMCGIKYLHQLGIVHRDIKPENILVCDHPDGSKSLKLGDFGLASEVVEPLLTVCGTPTYVAPEVLAEKGYGLKIDIWSSGVITYMLLCGFAPFISDSNKQDELFDKILSGKFQFLTPFWSNISESAKELVSRMLVVNPDERYSADDVLNHAWVSDDTAMEVDIHVSVRSQLGENMAAGKMMAKKRTGKPAVAIIATTALDKGSRYFQGCGSHLQPVKKKFENNNGHDEVF